jgi:hypothetical protein
MLGLEDNLTTEIEFWRELIDDRTPDCPQETLERMQLALALAEKKLHLLRLSGITWTDSTHFDLGKEH